MSEVLLKRPTTDAHEDDIIAFAKAWVRHVAEYGLDDALRYLDKREGDPPWSEDFVRSIWKDHFGDGLTCIITDPEAIEGLRVEAYRYNDGSGFAVDHDLAMNHKRSGLTAQFEFIRNRKGYAIYLADIHVL